MSSSNEPPLVSIVICTHNRRAWLAEAVLSVERQEGVSWEVIVVDDASDDDTLQWATERQAENFRVLHMPAPSGRAAAANKGLGEAVGKAIMFLDDDDLLRSRALMTLWAALCAVPGAVAAVGARWDWFGEGGGDGRRDSHPWFSSVRDVFPEFVFGWSAVSGQNLYRTTAVRKVGGYTVSPALWPCDDRDLWLRLARLGPVVLRPELVMTYRVHAGQWRPSDLGQIRERVARRAIRALPRRDRRRALLVRRSGRDVQAAELALSQGKYLPGLAWAVRGWLAAPGLWLSPLIGPWILRRLLRRSWHHARAKVRVWSKKSERANR